MFVYGIVRGVKGLLLNWRSATQHYVILTTTLCMLGVLALTVLNVQTLATHFLRSAPVSLFLKTDATSSERRTLLRDLKKHPLARDVRMITPEKGLLELTEQLGVDNALLKEIEPDTLPYTIDFRVPSHKKTSLRGFVRTLKKSPIVADVVLADTLLARMYGLFSALRGVGFFLLGLGLLAFVLVIMHATQLSLVSREKELQILSLMGVPQLSVHFSFMIESIMLTLTSGLSALVLLWFFLNAVRLALQVNSVAKNASTLLVYFSSTTCLGTLLVVSLLGVFGSTIVTHQILRAAH